MAKIKYRLLGDFGERRSLTFGDDPIAEISFNEQCDGYISIGNIVATVKGGVCRADLRRLADGEYEPHLYTDGGKVRLEGVILRGGKLLPAPTSEYALRRLFERIDALEGRILEISEVIEALKEKTEKKLQF